MKAELSRLLTKVLQDAEQLRHVLELVEVVQRERRPVAELPVLGHVVPCDLHHLARLLDALAEIAIDRHLNVLENHRTLNLLEERSS